MAASKTMTGLRERLRAGFAVPGGGDGSGLWRDPGLLGELGPALAGLHAEQPTVVAGIQSLGMLLGPLVALHLGAGFVAIHKYAHAGEDDGEPLWRRTTPPDYRDRSLELALPQRLVGRRDRVLLVDDWIETGAQATAVARLVRDAGARWVGVSVVVDGTTSEVRRRLNVRCLLRSWEAL
jgi:adenine phosphoribosyltransferase